MHKKIMTKSAKALKKDAEGYAKKAKKDTGIKKKHDLIEKREALAGSKDMKKRAKKAHEY